MCFSAPVSFTLGALLISTGTYCIKNTFKSNKAYLALAFIPLFFGLQQAFEGAVWLGLNYNDPRMVNIASFVFLFFALFFWPLWIPLAVYLLEPHKTRKKIIMIFIILGGLFGLHLLVLIYPNLLEVRVVNSSIAYTRIKVLEGSILNIIRQIVYVSITIIPLWISSNRYIKYFGWLMLLSMIITVFFYKYAVFSTWCFFAAFLSFYIIYILNKAPKISSANKI